MKKQKRKKQPRWRGRHPEKVLSTQSVVSSDPGSDPGSDPYSGAGDPGPTDLSDPLPADFTDPYDLGTAADPYDALDTFPFVVPTDNNIANNEQCMEDLHDAKATAEAVSKAQTIKSASCTARKSVMRSTMAAGKPIRRIPINLACVKARTELTGAIAKAAAAANKAKNDGCYSGRA